MAQVYLAGDLRNGVTFEMGSSVYRVVEFQHVKPGKGPAFIRTKIKNVMTGAVIEKTFNPTENLMWIKAVYSNTCTSPYFLSSSLSLNFLIRTGIIE